MLGAAAIITGSARTAAQNISGMVAEAETSQPIEAARVALIHEDGVIRVQTLSRGDGRFSLLAPHPGPWILAVYHLGFRTVRSDPVAINPGEWMVLQVTMAAEAIPLDPVVVTARRSVGSPAIQRFYDRRDQASRSGHGRFLARTDIEQISPSRPSDMLRTMAGIRVVRGAPGRGDGIRMASGCVPAIFIDGMRINRVGIHDSIDDYVSVMDIEGIEVYRGPSSQVAHLYDPSGCGLILVWTRAGVHDPVGGFRWRTLLGTLAAVAVLLLVIN
jgi:hypothetical protein